MHQHSQSVEEKDSGMEGAAVKRITVKVLTVSILSDVSNVTNFP